MIVRFLVLFTVLIITGTVVITEQEESAALEGAWRNA